MNRFLTLLTPDDLRRRRGFGGSILWINRDITDPDGLSSDSKIIITGKPNIGKTREALELAYRVVKTKLVAEDCVFEPSPELLIADPHFLESRLRSENQKWCHPVQPLRFAASLHETMGP